jgi:acyl carrier protein
MKPIAAPIRVAVNDIIKQTTAAWDLDDEPIEDTTTLIADLGFSSVDLIHLMASIEMHFHRKFPYDEIIMKDGQYVDDITVLELMDFVSRNIDRPAPGPQAM